MSGPLTLMFKFQICFFMAPTVLAVLQVAVSVQLYKKLTLLVWIPPRSSQAPHSTSLRTPATATEAWANADNQKNTMLS